MKRAVVIPLLLLGIVLIGTRESRAQLATTSFNGFCFSGPANQLVPCMTATPGTATAVSIVPVKDLAVSTATAEPAGMTAYGVTVTSQVACFSLTEPINVYTIGSASASALTAVSPVAISSSPHAVTVEVNPDTGQANLSLEVFSKVVGPEGLAVKAVWPQEAVERAVQVIAPAITTTPTPVPATGTATVTPTGTVTSSAATSATATATPTGPFFVRACVSPNPMVGATPATLYAQSVPGAVCTASVTYANGSHPTSFNGSAQPTDSGGFATWSWNEDTTANGGTATVACVAGSEKGSATASFTVTH